MANEWILKVETHTPINFNCLSTLEIEKGAVCQMTDPMKASISDGDNDVVGGITQSEKLAGDNRVSIALYRGGIFEATLNGTCNVGDPLVTDSSTGGENKVAVAATNEKHVIAIALETGTDEERIFVELRPTTMQLV